MSLLHHSQKPQNAPEREYLRKLFLLLDDSSEVVAREAMCELLRHEAHLGNLLGEFQESDDPVMRKRVHQLQSILILRGRRRAFSQMLESGDVDMLEGLVELHLLWFDNDSQPSIYELFQSFMDAAETQKIRNISDLRDFMVEANFMVSSEEDLANPGNFCIGSVLEERVGSDLILSVLTLMVAIENNLEMALARLPGGRFAVLTAKGEAMIPADHWKLEKHISFENCEFYSDPVQILRYAAMMLFYYAASSDNFRYIHTIGHVLCPEKEHKEETPLGFLPYPYNGGTRPKRKITPKSGEMPEGEVE